MTNLTGKKSFELGTKAINSAAIRRHASDRLRNDGILPLLEEKATDLITKLGLKVEKEELIKLLATYNHFNLGEVGIENKDMVDFEAILAHSQYLEQEGNRREYAEKIRSANNRGTLSENQWRLILETHEMMNEVSFLELSATDREAKRLNLRTGILNDGTRLQNNEKFTDEQINTLIYYIVCGNRPAILLGIGITLLAVRGHSKCTADGPLPTITPTPQEVQRANQNRRDTLPVFNEATFLNSMRANGPHYMHMGGGDNNLNFSEVIVDKGYTLSAVQRTADLIGVSDYYGLGAFPFYFGYGFKLSEIKQGIKHKEFNPQTGELTIRVSMPFFKLQESKSLADIGRHTEKETDNGSAAIPKHLIDAADAKGRERAMEWLRTTYIPGTALQNVQVQCDSNTMVIGQMLSIAGQAAVTNGKSKKTVIYFTWEVEDFKPQNNKVEEQRGGGIRVGFNFDGSNLKRDRMCSGGHITYRYTQEGDNEPTIEITEDELEYKNFIKG